MKTEISVNQQQYEQLSVIANKRGVGIEKIISEAFMHFMSFDEKRRKNEPLLRRNSQDSEQYEPLSLVPPSVSGPRIKVEIEINDIVWASCQQIANRYEWEDNEFTDNVLGNIIFLFAFYVQGEKIFTRIRDRRGKEQVKEFRLRPLFG